MRALITLLFFVACAPTGRVADSSPRSTAPPLVVFVVRHAEKIDDSRDPELTAAGHERAAALARWLRSVDLDHVHSSDYARTRQTAAPTAKQHGLEVELYDARDLPTLVQRLRQTGGRHLVVGHSNTSPDVVDLLTGEAGPPIADAEYDRLYVVWLASDGTASTIRLSYGR